MPKSELEITRWELDNQIFPCLIVDLHLSNESLFYVEGHIRKYMDKMGLSVQNKIDIFIIDGFFRVLITGSQKAIKPGIEYLRKNHADKEEQLNAQG